jgi:outer membrane protein OmpA-like peptidoglycan-associated protein
MRRLFTTALLVSSLLARAQEPLRAIVYFDYDRYELTPEARQQLDSLKKRLQNRFVDSCFINAHCDSIGSLTYNDRLSERRAASVSAYLNLETGHTEGWGKRRPLNDNGNAALRQQNRRAEISIWSHEAITGTLQQQIENAAPGDRTIVLKNMNFVGGRHHLLASSYRELTELINAMKNLPSLEIEIQGHICCERDTSDGIDLDLGTRDLSVQRAKAIYQILVNEGIDPKRMRYTGFGHRFPLTLERTPVEQTLNRRVEIKILKK